MVTTTEVQAALAAFADGEHSDQSMRVAEALAALAGVGDFDPLLTSGQVAALAGVGRTAWRTHVARGTAPAACVERLTGCGTRRLWRRSAVLAWSDGGARKAA